MAVVRRSTGLSPIRTERIDGLRVTDAATLEVTESELCGTVNKALVRALMRRGANAAGISGEDAGLLIARPVFASDGRCLGFVGEIASVAPRVLVGFPDAGLMPAMWRRSRRARCLPTERSAAG